MADEKPPKHSLLRIFPDRTEALPCADFLKERGVPCEAVSSPAEEDDGGLPGVARGIWLWVPEGDRARAETLLASDDAAVAGAAQEAGPCPECGSAVFSAVPPSAAPAGSWWLRCMNCGRTLPASERAYLRGDAPLLPVACPQCASFFIEEADPPPLAMGGDEERPWCACEACGHRWAPPLEVKGPGLCGTIVAPSLPRPPEAGREDFQPDPEETGGDPSPDEPAGDAHPVAPPDDSDDPWACPRCGSKRVYMNDANRAADQTVRLLCQHCSEVWDVLLKPDEPLPDLPRLDEGDASTNEGMRCPSCREGRGQPIEPPAWAGESRLSLFFKSLFTGKSWYRCERCGHEWEG